MNPVPKKEAVDQVRSEIRAVLGQSVSQVFFGRIDAILEDWSTGKITAGQACEQVQKRVSLFIDEDKAREIGNRCSPIIMREFVPSHK